MRNLIEDIGFLHEGVTIPRTLERFFNFNKHCFKLSVTLPLWVISDVFVETNDYDDVAGDEDVVVNIYYLFEWLPMNRSYKQLRCRIVNVEISDPVYITDDGLMTSKIKTSMRLQYLNYVKMKEYEKFKCFFDKDFVVTNEELKYNSDKIDCKDGIEVFTEYIRQDS